MVIDPSGPVTDILDRASEVKRLAELIAGGRDVLVYGPRRLGKSSLIRHVVDAAAKDRLVFLVDCTRKETDEEIAQVLLSQLNGFGAKWKRFWDWVKEHIEGTRTRIILDGKDPRIELDPSARSGRSIPDAVELIARVAKSAKTPVLVIFDEWQVAMRRGGDGFMWQMRSVSQAHPGLHYLFSGSEPTILAKMLDKKNKAFFMGLVEVPIAGIGVDDVLPDLSRHGIELTGPARTLLRDSCGTTTLRLMEVLHRLQGRGNISQRMALEAIAWTAKLHAPDFERELALAKPGPQRRCLLGLARDRPEHPTGHEFVRAHGLTSAPTARAAMKRLKQLDILNEDNEFNDALFRWYLANDPERQATT